MKKIYSSILIWALVLAFATTGLAQKSPGKTMEDSITSILKVLKDPAYTGDEGYERQKEIVESIIDQVFDFRELSMRALGRPWLKLTDAQKDDFVDKFSSLLEAVYENRLRGYQAKEKKSLHQLAQNMRVDYTKEMIKGDRAMVLTNLVSETAVTPVNYRMILKQDGWKVYDVIVEGVSLIKNYRTQFKDILRTSTPQELIDMLGKKITQEKNKEPEQEATGSAK